MLKARHRPLLDPRGRLPRFQRKHPQMRLCQLILRLRVGAVALGIDGGEAAGKAAVGQDL